jgi:predicted dehydrogenase
MPLNLINLGGVNMTINMAVIGMGGMAGWHRETIAKHIPEIKIKGAYDVREEARAHIAKLGIHNYASPDELYEDKTIDLVLIATPNDVHKSYAVSLLEAGKNVICEKPVTLNAGELEEIISVAERTGKIFTVHQNRRWDSDYLTVKKILTDGLLHNPYTIESRVQGSRRGMFGWRSHKINGGGMVLDWGIHLLDQMLDLIPGRVVSVNAHLHYIGTQEVDDCFTAMIRFESGLTYVVNISMNSFVVQPRWHISCEDGTAVIKNWELEGRIVKLSDPSELDWSEDIIYTAAGPTRSMLPRPKETTVEIPLPVVKGNSVDYYKNIVEVLRGKAAPIVTPAQALRVMKVVDAVFESQRTGASVSARI